jgi:hypothetical protein
MIEGKCKRCGQCCKVGPRFKYRREEMNGPLEFWRYDKDQEVKPCDQLSFDSDGKAVCLIYEDKSRCHGICDVYPVTFSEVIFRNCGFNTNPLLFEANSMYRTKELTRKGL